MQQKLDRPHVSQCYGLGYLVSNATWIKNKCNPFLPNNPVEAAEMLSHFRFPETTKPAPVTLARPAINSLRGLWYLATNYAVNVSGTLVDDRFRSRLFDAEKMQEHGKFYAMFQNDPNCLRFEHIDQKYW
jgi:hypothetical protein